MEDIKESFDYQAHYGKNSPAALQPSQHTQRRREQMRKQRITIRLDHDVVEQFKALAPEEGYQTLINQALRDWLVAQSIKELVRQELSEAIKQAFLKGAYLHEYP